MSVAVRVLVHGAALERRELLTALAAEHAAQLVWVEPDDAAAEEQLLKLALSGDIIVTHDLGLATVCQKKGCRVISPKGHWFYEKQDFREEDRRFEEELRHALEGE